MNELKTRILLRNDSVANWLANSTVVLLKGEVGIEFQTDGKAKLKIGDGVKTWSELEYFCGAVENIEQALAEIEAMIGIVPEGKTVMELIGEKVDAADVYTKEEIDGMIGGLYRYCGTKANYADLPTEGMKVGDVYNIENLDLDHGIMPGDNVAWNGEGWDKLGGVVDLSGYVTTEKFSEVVDKLPEIYLSKEEAKVAYEFVKYEVTSKPVGTLVDYRDKEIRIMCPADTQWTQQNSGENADSSMYYLGIKIYAPSDDVVSFKEDTKDTISDETMYYFEGNDFAGVDAYGRKYSIVWLPAANYNAETQAWTYYGSMSSKDKFIGWYYSVEWYNVDGVKIGSDMVRINLSNEDCHNSIVPSYLTTVNVNNLVQSDGEVLVLNGGSSAV